jgi:hypothetical protein
MMSVTITELIWQAETWEKSNQEVGNLRFVVFQLIAYRIYSVYASTVKEGGMVAE